MVLAIGLVSALSYIAFGILGFSVGLVCQLVHHHQTKPPPISELPVPLVRRAATPADLQRLADRENVKRRLTETRTARPPVPTNLR